MNDLKTEQTAIVTRETSGLDNFFTPKTDSRVSELAVIAKAFALSGYFEDLNTQNLKIGVSQALVKILRGQDLGFSPSASIENIYIIEKRTSVSAASLLALIRRSGGDIDIWVETEKECKVTFYRDADKEQTLGVVHYTIEDAQRAGLLAKSNWRRTPKDMLFWRCISRGFKRYFSDLAMGAIYTPEELGYSVQGGVLVRDEQPAMEAVSSLSDNLDKTDLNPQYADVEADYDDAVSDDEFESEPEPGEEMPDEQPAANYETRTDLIKSDWPGIDAVNKIDILFTGKDQIDFVDLVRSEVLGKTNMLFSLDDMDASDKEACNMVLNRLTRLMGKRSSMQRLRDFLSVLMDEIYAGTQGWGITNASSVDACISAFVAHEKEA